jgi:hypothetical protein
MPVGTWGVSVVSGTGFRCFFSLLMAANVGQFGYP